MSFNISIFSNENSVSYRLKISSLNTFFERQDLESIYSKMQLQNAILANKASLTEYGDTIRLEFTSSTRVDMSEFLLLFRTCLYQHTKNFLNSKIPLTFTSNCREASLFFILLDPSLGVDTDYFLLLVLLEVMQGTEMASPYFKDFSEDTVNTEAIPSHNCHDLSLTLDFIRKLQEITWDVLMDSALQVRWNHPLQYYFRGFYPILLKYTDNFLIEDVLAREDLSSEFRRFASNLAKEFKFYGMSLRIIPYPHVSYHPQGKHVPISSNDIIPYHLFDSKESKWHRDSTSDLKYEAIRCLKNELNLIPFTKEGELFFPSQYLLDASSSYPDFKHPLAALSFNLQKDTPYLDSLTFNLVYSEGEFVADIRDVSKYLPILIQTSDSSLHLLIKE